MNTHPKNGPENGGKSTRLEFVEGWGGPEDAEEFRKKLLEALNSFDKVEVLFNAPVGYSASMLERVFGGLIRDEGQNKQYLDKHLELIPANSLYRDYVGLARHYIDRIDKEINDAAAGVAAQWKSLYRSLAELIIPLGPALIVVVLAATLAVWWGVGMG